jgi:hypothetical protein
LINNTLWNTDVNADVVIQALVEFLSSRADTRHKGAAVSAFPLLAVVVRVRAIDLGRFGSFARLNGGARVVVDVWVVIWRVGNFQSFERGLEIFEDTIR